MEQNWGIHAHVSYTRYRTGTTVEFLLFPSPCVFCARNATSRERIERRRDVKSDWIDLNEELLAEIDTTNQRDSKNVRKGDIACEDGSARAGLCLNDTWVNDRVPR